MYEYILKKYRGIEKESKSRCTWGIAVYFFVSLHQSFNIFKNRLIDHFCIIVQKYGNFFSVPSFQKKKY